MDSCYPGTHAELSTPRITDGSMFVKLNLVKIQHRRITQAYSACGDNERRPPFPLYDWLLAELFSDPKHGMVDSIVNERAVNNS